MKKYLYTCLVPTFITLVVNGESIELQMHNGDEVDLPEHRFVAVLEKQGKITEVNTDAADSLPEGKGKRYEKPSKEKNN